MTAKKPDLVTCCPSCMGTFYVTPQQLSKHNGEVRCGKCNHVFNALNRLGELSTEPRKTEAEPNKTGTTSEIAALETQAEASTPSAVFNISNYSAAPKITRDLASKSKLRRRKTQPPQLSYVILTGVFLVTAGLQSIYYMRTEIASRWPELKPHLVKACAFLDCAINLPQKVALIAIDDSDLQEDAEHQGLIHLSSTIINNAGFVQAYPLLEVTLTDTYDKPILRRAFTPAEYLPSGTDINKGMAANEEVRIRLGLTASGEPVAGYRVFVTYS